MIFPASFSTVNAICTGGSPALAFAIWGSNIGDMTAVGLSPGVENQRDRMRATTTSGTNRTRSSAMLLPLMSN
jgi:hypothetical protein